MTGHILVVEDDRDIAELLEYTLTQERFTVDACTNGIEAVSKATRTHPDLIILDLMLPDMGGIDVCKTLRAGAKTRHIPIIMLTAKGDEMDRVVGFEVGADDYLTKPFSPRELVLRVKSILRRTQESPLPPKPDKMASVFSFGALTVDPGRFKVTVTGEEVHLTALEFKLLHYLYGTQGRVATRDALLDGVWGFETALTTRTVDTHVKRLRQKLGRAGAYIETVHGVGYRFAESADLQ